MPFYIILPIILPRTKAGQTGYLHRWLILDRVSFYNIFPNSYIFNINTSSTYSTKILAPGKIYTNITDILHCSLVLYEI